MKSFTMRFLLCFVALVALHGACFAKRHELPPDPRFAEIDRIVILPVFDARGDRRAHVDLHKLGRLVEKVIKSKRYQVTTEQTTGAVGELRQADLILASPAMISKLGPADARWVLVIGLGETSGNSLVLGSAEAFGYLFDKATASLLWSGTGSGHPVWAGPTRVGAYGLNQAAADSTTNLVMMLTGMEKHDVLTGAFSNLLLSIPKLPKAQKTHTGNR